MSQLIEGERAKVNWATFLVKSVKSTRFIGYWHERVISYYSRVAKRIDLQIVKPLTSVRIPDLPYFPSSL